MAKYNHTSRRQREALFAQQMKSFFNVDGAESDNLKRELDKIGLNGVPGHRFQNDGERPAINLRLVHNPSDPEPRLYDITQHDRLMSQEVVNQLTSSFKLVEVIHRGTNSTRYVSRDEKSPRSKGKK